MTKAKKLDLDSQIQLLTRVRFLTRFGSHLIHLSGAQGSGKTWLAHSFLEHYATDCRQILLTCQLGYTDAQHRTLLLQQFVSQAMFNEHDSLCQSAEHLLAQHQHKLIVVIDDAHLLSDGLVAELWALSLYANQHSQLQLNIILFANRGELNQTLAHVSHDSDIIPLELEIDDISHQEVALFSEMLIANDESDTPYRPTLKQRLLMLLPRSVVLQHPSQAEGISMSLNSKKRLLLPLAIVIVLIVLIAIGYRFMAPRSVDSQSSTTVASSAPVSATAVVTIDKEPLPPQVNTQGLTVGRQEEAVHERIVISEQQIDAMIDDHALKGHSEATEATEAESTPAIIDTQPLSAAVISAPASKLDWSLKLAANEQQLAAVKPDHYALQLAATRSLAAAAEFIMTHNVAAAMIYQTERNQQSWFIVVTGNYATAQQARTAKTQLPTSLQQLKPWLKPYRHIQQEMNRLK
ncbi:SPOR domain-containing protein [Photobacterium kishitanii]|uniref:SPOR domain-containing protein n=1 Tax=Photobacterium kishitanii TaxID=318456 RepID=UPI0015E71835|nr:AAA family ATPase [Photobacterium kishitanii]